MSQQFPFYTFVFHETFQSVCDGDFLFLSSPEVKNIDKGFWCLISFGKIIRRKKILIQCEFLTSFGITIYLVFLFLHTDI